METPPAASRDPSAAGNPGAPNAAPGAAPGVAPAVAQEVARLLAAGKCKQAVELAKDEHKWRHSPGSERLLVDAYLRRIEQFEARGAFEDARVLVNLVADRFPAHRPRRRGGWANW